MPEVDPEPLSPSLPFVEALYEEYLRDPGSVPSDWVAYFESINGSSIKGLAPKVRPSFARFSVFNPPRSNGGSTITHLARMDRVRELQHAVDMLMRNYRVRGHLMACQEAVGNPPVDLPELDPAYYNIGEEELDLSFSTHYLGGDDTMTLREIIARLQNTYCRSIGVQFMHIDDLTVRDWLQERMERTENRLNLRRETQLQILRCLTDAVVLEEFIQRKYPGAKSFSLEGAESLIPLLLLALERAADHGIEETVFGMPHRGRLNVLANIMGKDPAQIFREYEDRDPDSYTGRGDVKYHLGYHSDWYSQNGRKVHLALCFNPSHLEFVNPVACGRMRAWQDRIEDKAGDRGMVVLIHGDAAFAGEGIVQETLNMSSLTGYRTGGTLHVVVNNQLGFTTTPSEYRSTTYCTDVAKMLQSPIFHVDGEDPEAVAQVVELAMQFRRSFRRDVVIDMYCYRKRGHNEGDEPAFTQPLLYKEIARRKSVRQNYMRRLLKLGEITEDDAGKIAERSKARLEEALDEAREQPQVRPPSVLRGLWSNYRGGPDVSVQDVDTGVGVERLSELLTRLTKLPADFTPHAKYEKLMDSRRKMASGESPLDWSTAETLAFATLVSEGAHVRLTGQDSERGTFSQRHAVVHDYENGERYTPLQHVAGTQASFDIYNSPLCEMGVLGFEYGYSIGCPDGLVIWEAQFGDFCNAGQVIIDQFISSAEDKWRSLSGLTLLLPHGFEGMGPEHSSARLERFLALSAEDNMQVCVPSTPAQYFHLLRRQVHRPWRKPLIVMTPKSLLRNPRATSTLEELSTGRFLRLLPDDSRPAEGIKRILLCSGKIYYDLTAEREALSRDDIAIIRVEQIYPLQPEHLETVLAPYTPETPVYWVQEEPENMGAWRRMKGKFGERLLGRFPFTVACRPASASPATGSAHSHRIEQKLILSIAFGSEMTSWY